MTSQSSASDLDIAVAPRRQAAPADTSVELLATALGWIARIVAWALLALAVAGVAFWFLKDHGLHRPGLVRSLALLHNGWSATVQHLGAKVTKIGPLAARAIIVVLLLLAARLCAAVSNRAFDTGRYRRFRREYENLKSQHRLDDNSSVLSPVHATLEQLRAGKLQNRAELLTVFAEAKRKLDEIGRDLAFLSIDVVNSTGMKEGEEKAAVEHDFKEFQVWAERGLRQSGVLKMAWTPDGAMTVFHSVDEAVTAAQHLLDGLDEFNRGIKVVRRPFALRCGVNAGYVYFEADAPLESLSDRVIDIAAHLQRNAPPNALCVARPAIEPLRARQGFEPTGRIVDGYEVFEWRHGDAKSD